MKIKTTNVRFFDPSLEYRRLIPKIDNEMRRIFFAGDLILREDVEKFEEKLARFVGTQYAVGLSSGTDALYLSLKAIGVTREDEVITTSHTFKATVGAIINVGATPIMVDIGADGLIDADKIEEKITKKTKAIIPVHIAGAVCDMEKIRRIAEKYNLSIIEDACQALGAIKNPTTSVQCWSFYPAKILGAMGDAGAITTNDKKIADYVREARNHFKGTNEDFGGNHRMDNLQACILNLKMDYIVFSIDRRQELADVYYDELKDLEKSGKIKLPNKQNGRVYQDFIIQNEQRNELYQFLKEQRVETMKNEYPFPPKYPKLPLAAKYEAETLRLPCNANLWNWDARYVTSKIKAFFYGF